MFSSIRVRLIASHMALLLALLSLLALFLYTRLSRIVQDTVDSRLQARAVALASALDWGESGRLEIPDALRAEYDDPRSGSYFELRDPTGKGIGRSASLEGASLPWIRTSFRVFETVRLRGEPVRMVVYPTRLEEGEGGAHRPVVIECAVSMRGERHLLGRFAATLLGAIAAILALSALGNAIVARAALQPVRSISAAIERVSEANLAERIPVGSVATELQGVAAAFNRTIARLEEAFRRQQEFTADASHELRTPLSVILSHGEVALRKPREPAEYQASISTILHTTRLMSTIVEKLLRLARLGGESAALQFENLNLGEVLADATHLIAPLATERGVTLANEAAGSIPVCGDRAALVELFMNLLDNAVKYNRPGGAVTIRATRQGDQVLAAVADTGIGIAESERSHLFERFYRVDKSRSRELGGAGLGLSICAEIIRLHSGALRIESEEGKGTTVTASLPAARAG